MSLFFEGSVPNESRFFAWKKAAERPAPGGCDMPNPQQAPGRRAAGGPGHPMVLRLEGATVASSPISDAFPRNHIDI